MVTKFIDDVDLDEYYGGTLTPYAALSQSVAHELVSRSPKHAWAKHPRLGGHVSEPSDEMELGNVLDELVLGGSRRIQSIPFDDYRTNAAKAARDAARADGKIPVKESKLITLQAVAERAKKSFSMAGVELTGLSQVCILWESRATNGALVQCQALLDHVLVDDGLILDLKTADNASPVKLGAKCFALGYEIQSAAYREAFVACFPEFVGRTRFRNCFLETSWPHVTVVTEMDGEMSALGEARWRRAVDTWEECLRTDTWPAYTAPREVLRVSPPSWAMAEEMMLTEAV
jgi:hypothetical protein